MSYKQLRYNINLLVLAAGKMLIQQIVLWTIILCVAEYCLRG